MTLPTTRGDNCLDDTVLLAIAQGSMVEPALSHFLSHLENCPFCCERSEYLGQAHPAGISALLDRFAVLEKTKPRQLQAPETKEYPWQKELQNLGPRLPTPPLPEPTAEGAVWFGPWEILGILGEGRAAVVYKARDNRLGRQVALKVLRPDVAAIPGMAESFLGEAKAMAQARDPHLVVLYSHGSEPQPFLEMELLEGETLAQAVQKGPMEPTRALKITQDVAAGLAQLHARGLVHRDLKPANIWLLNRDGQEQAVLMDLGLVAFGSTRSGTPGYMAPELLTGTAQTAQPTSDIFSLGALLRTMALGGDSAAKATGKPHSTLAPVIRYLMSDMPEKRPSAKMVVGLIDELLREPRKKTRRAMAILVGGLVLAAMGLWTLPRNPEKPIPAPLPAKIPGAPAFKTFAGAFSEQEVSLQLGLHTHANRVYLLTSYHLHRLDLDSGAKESLAIPFPVEQFSFAGKLLALANSRGDVEVWNLDRWPPKPLRRYQLPQGQGQQLISISLAPNQSGNLLVALRDTIFTANPRDGDYPETLAPHGEAKLFSNNLQPAAMALDDTGTRVLGLHGRGGVTLHALNQDHVQIWAFRPILYGPAVFTLRPRHPGQIAIGSPQGDVALYGPEIVRVPKGNPYPKENWFRKFPGRVLDLDFASENLLVVLTSLAPCPLKYTHAHLGGQVWHDLACESPVTLAADRDQEQFLCLDIHGNLHQWRAEDFPAPDQD